MAAAALVAATALAGPGPEPGTMRTTGDFAPLWSPVAEQIAFARVEEGAGDPDDAALYVLDLGSGVERRLTRLDLEASSYAWSPDGTKLAFGRSGGGDYGASSVHSIRVDGTGARRLSRGAWFVGFTTADEVAVSFCDPGYNFPYCVPRASAAGTFDYPSGCFAAEPRFETLGAACRHRGRSPDGRRSVVGTGGSESVVLTRREPDGAETQSLGEGDAPEWSPDGDSIAFLSRTADGLRRGGGSRVVFAYADCDGEPLGGKIFRLGTTAGFQPVPFRYRTPPGACSAEIRIVATGKPLRVDNLR